MNAATSSNPPVNTRARGLAMVLFGASMWGLSGTVAQKLFHEYGFSPGWLVTVRLLISGALLLLLGAANGKKGQITAVWKSPQDWIQLLIFGILGMLGVQYTFFAAIDTGNAATATLLQYLAPLLITVYVALRARKMPTLIEFAAIGLALVGTLLLVTGGKWDGLAVPGIAVFWGLLSAVALAFYTLHPASLLKKWGSEVVVGWGMLVGGCGMMLINPPWETSGQVWTVESVLLIAFVVLFGTLLAFYLYMESLRCITPTETSLLACIEPLVAVVASVVWLQVPFGVFEVLGGLCIIGTVTILTLRSKEKESLS